MVVYFPYLLALYQKVWRAKNAPMIDETELQHHRKRRLRELIDTFFGGRIVDLATLIGMDRNYVGRMLYPVGKNQWRPISDKSARIITDAARLPTNWLDLPIGSGIPNHAAAPPAGAPRMVREESPPYIPQAATPSETIPMVWPFRLVDSQRLVNLQKALGPRRAADVMREIDAYLDIMVSRWEAEAQNALRARAA